jgi:hypothetical protein
MPLMSNVRPLMQRVELLTVQERFQISWGLTLVPDFPIPGGWWRNREELVLVVTPEGREFELPAQFNMVHFNIRDPEASVDRRWRVVVSLPSGEKEQVPIGSKVFVSPEVQNALVLGGVA